MPIKAVKAREHIANSLRHQHPDWSAEKVESTSYAIEQNKWKEKTGHPAFIGKD